ncbi:hypothetical protein Tco_0448545 [Tanacetum coccineum]
MPKHINKESGKRTRQLRMNILGNMKIMTKNVKTFLKGHNAEEIVKKLEEFLTMAIMVGEEEKKTVKTESGQPKKKKKAKKDLFTIYFNYDGIFTCSPLKYNQGHMKELNDTNLHDMSYEHLKEIALRLVPHGCFEKLYYCQTGGKLNLGLRELRSNQDIGDMLKVGYENRNEIDMYVEHFGHDIMELAELERNEEQNHNSIESSDDEYYGSDDCEEIENLCSARIIFRGTAKHHETETPLVDPDENQIDYVNKVQSGVLYPAFDSDIPWDKMEPTLGMRYETPHQLKLALANYGVAHGYQLWYMKNDWREVLVYCGRNVEDGRCAGVKKKVVRKKVVKKKVVKKKPVSDSGEGTSQSPKWTKKQRVKCLSIDLVEMFKRRRTWGVERREIVHEKAPSLTLGYPLGSLGIGDKDFYHLDVLISSDSVADIILSSSSSPFHDNPYMKVVQAYDAIPPPQVIIALLAIVPLPMFDS